MPGQRQISTRYTPDDSAHIISLIGNSQDLEYDNMDSALALVDSAMFLSRSKNFGYGIGNAFIAYAVYATTQGNYELADSFYQKAYPYCYFASKISGSNRLLALWYENTGILATYQGDFEKAVARGYKKLQVLNEYPKDSSLIVARVSAYNGIGAMLQYLNQQDKALYYLRKGEELAKEHHLETGLAQIYVNFGSAYSGKKEWEKAKWHYEQGLEIAKKYQNIFVIQVAYLGLGEMYNASGNRDTAIGYLENAMQLSDKTNPYMAKAAPYLMLGQIHFAKKEYRKAIEYGKITLELSKQFKMPQIRSQAHALLADGYMETANWEEAYHHQFAYTALKDSISTTKKTLKINQLEVKYRVAEKDKQLVEQNLSLNKQKSNLREKNFWIGGISTVVLLLSGLLFILYRNYMHRKKLAVGQMEIVRLKAMVDGEEKERGRIAKELHDGVASQLLAVKLNLTTTIDRQNEKILKAADFKQSLEYLEEAMLDLKSTAQNLMPENAMKHGLIVALQQFCNKMENSAETEIIFQVYGNIEPQDAVIKLSILRIVQELVQNALKHAHASYILVQLNCEKDILGITVQDDGIGFDLKKINEGQGLHNLNTRINALNGFVEINSGTGGTSIYLELKNIS